MCNIILCMFLLYLNNAYSNRCHVSLNKQYICNNMKAEVAKIVTVKLMPSNVNGKYVGIFVKNTD